jgi:hypothetical protein
VNPQVFETSASTNSATWACIPFRTGCKITIFPHNFKYYAKII